MENPLLYLGVGFLACLLGTIPVGPINLTVVKTTVDHNSTRGLEVALAASLVEILEALVAIFFGMLISDYLESNLGIKLVIAGAFIVLAVVVFTRRPSPQADAGEAVHHSFFRRGLLIALLNPQAIPFWIFALAAISQYVDFIYAGPYLALFLAGVFLGKLLALYGYVLASGYIKTHLSESSRVVNRVLAGVLLVIGLSQGWNAVSALLV